LFPSSATDVAADARLLEQLLESVAGLHVVAFLPAFAKVGHRRRPKCKVGVNQGGYPTTGVTSGTAPSKTQAIHIRMSVHVPGSTSQAMRPLRRSRRLSREHRESSDAREWNTEAQGVCHIGRYEHRDSFWGGLRLEKLRHGAAPFHGVVPAIMLPSAVAGATTVGDSARSPTRSLPSGA
jgi:hypothetical protein